MTIQCTKKEIKTVNIERRSILPEGKVGMRWGWTVWPSVSALAHARPLGACTALTLATFTLSNCPLFKHHLLKIYFQKDS